jgi:DNA-binding beta-propeller fold protein YncE
LVIDTGNRRISVWTRPSISSTTWSNSAQFGTYGWGERNFNHPRGVVVSADSLTAWVADAGNHRIAIWTRPDKDSTAWRPSTQFGSRGVGNDNFNGPAGIAVSGDTLTAWVADGGNHRIAVWTRPDKDSTDWRASAHFSAFGTGASKLRLPVNVAVTPDGLTALVSGVASIGLPAGVVEIWTKS